MLITLLSIHLISIVAHLEWPPPPTTAATAAYSNNLVVRDIIPSWLPSKERKLLQMSPGNMRIDAVVASDGSGQFARIGDALKAVPDNSGTRFVIYVKEGVYVENVVVEATKSNVMIIGDGMDATVVSGSLSTAEESSMFSTATFGVLATDFIACDIGFENTAGAAKNQAVALAVDGDRGVFYRCKMVGFQDTLYAQANRQFFRDCAIYGTIDFICGDSAAVFQNCDIRPRRPLPGQFNSITAQSRADPSSQTGFSFQDCRITAAEDLSGVQTFLGRPEMAATPPNKTPRLNIIIIGLSCVVLVACVVGVAVGVAQTQNGKSKPSGVQNLSATLKAICDATLYPDSCYTTLGPAATSDNLRPQDIYKLSVRIAVAELSRASDAFFNGDSFRKISDRMAARALETCHELLSLAMENLNDSMATPEKKLFQSFSDLKTWLSSAGTNIETCADTFTNTTHELSTMVMKNLKNSSELTSNSLAILSAVEKSIEYSMEYAAGILGSVGKRRLMNLDPPSWLSGHDRRLLQSSNWGLKIDAVVAKDGSGKYKTIKDALDAVPDKSDKRFVIYVKKGVYFENVKVEKSKWNVMMIGDGKDATVVSGNLNFVDGTPTFQTATFGKFILPIISITQFFPNV
nr:probable pectinesterase/pectinesterase inhibitor 46 [Ipomoea batatas]